MKCVNGFIVYWGLKYWIKNRNWIKSVNPEQKLIFNKFLESPQNITYFQEAFPNLKLIISYCVKSIFRHLTELFLGRHIKKSLKVHIFIKNNNQT